LRLFTLLLILFPLRIDFDFQNEFIVWNIGQGQWITAIDSNVCYHFDVGGEFFNQNKLIRACAKKQNVIFYSHWDWDHIGLTSKLRSSVNNLCIAALPKGDTSAFKKKLLARIPVCQNTFSDVKKIDFEYPRSTNANDLSQIFVFKNKFLIPGDSTKKMEKIWSSHIPNNLKCLSVSHHGSQTSTSEYFLEHVHGIKQAFVSARRAVYGHPHKVTVDRLHQHGIALLKTEDWGNIVFLYFPKKSY
jgi:competence protein ComEC